MKNHLTKTALGIAAMLILTSLPAYSSTVFYFNYGTGTGTYSGSGSSISGSFTGTNIEEAVGAVDTYFPSQLGNMANLFAVSFANSSNTLTISNNATSGAFASLGNLFSAVTTLTLTNSGSNLNDTVSGLLYGSTAFDSAFGFATGTEFEISGSISGSGGTVTSESLEVTETPEPASVLLLGAGLLALGLIARKRRFGTV